MRTVAASRRTMARRAAIGEDLTRLDAVFLRDDVDPEELRSLRLVVLLAARHGDAEEHHDSGKRPLVLIESIPPMSPGLVSSDLIA